MNNELFFAQNKPILEDMKSITLRGINSTGDSGYITSFVDQDGKTMDYQDVLALMNSQCSSSGERDKSPSVLLFLELTDDCLVPCGMIRYNSSFQYNALTFIKHVYGGPKTLKTTFYVVTLTPTQATYTITTQTLSV